MTVGNSRSVTSNQAGPHEALVNTVERFRCTDEFRKPIAPFNLAAFSTAADWLDARPGPWILDAGCGTGDSTCRLGERYPGLSVIGVDRSEHRLSRRRQQPDNVLFTRADLVDFWRLAADAGWSPQKQFLLYPNPYPRKQQFKQRWHTHPVFRHLVRLGGQLECRTNWPLYLKEMQQALGCYDIDAQVTELQSPEGLSPFERKYSASGQPLWCLRADLGARSSGAAKPSPQPAARGFRP